MLKEIKINNLAIIKDIQMEFCWNFSSLTGETGAGKSIILDGISLITGSRANTNSIRNGENKLTVEAVFSVDDNLKRIINEKYDDILDDDELIIYREIDTNAKSKITLNGKRITLSTLSDIMENIIDIVGQHENQYLLNKSFHLELLDGFLDKNDNNVKEVVNRIKSIDKKIYELEENRDNLIEKKQVYEFNIKEIDDLKLTIGIDEELENMYKIKFNSGRISENIGQSISIIDQNLLKNLKICYKNINLLSDLSSEYTNIAMEIDDIIDRLSEISNSLYTKLDDDNYDIDLDEIVSRINKINKLKVKYGDSIESILEYRNDLSEKLNSLSISNDTIIDLKNEREQLYLEYLEKCTILSKKRQNIAKIIEKRINEELNDLNMKDAEFKINFEKKDGLFDNGLDDIEFMLKTNKGSKLEKLSKIASGGEISRIMLALKIVFSEVDNLSTLIFDEIDAGISGQTVKMVAQKLKKLSNNVQVICVTHSPNIAAYSQEQFLIKKSNTIDKTITSIHKLEYSQRIDEIARIISGENITDELRNVVDNMIKDGNKYE